MADRRVPIQVKIYHPVKSGNQVLRMHWSQRKKYNDQWFIAVMKELPKQSAKPGKRRMVTITSFRRKMVDDDNLRFGCKPIMDALTRLNYLDDDNPNAVIAFYIQKIVSHNQTKTDEVRTEIVIDDYKGSKYHRI